MTLSKNEGLMSNPVTSTVVWWWICDRANWPIKNTAIRSVRSGVQISWALPRSWFGVGWGQRQNTMGTYVKPSFLGVISPIYWGLKTFIFHGFGGPRVWGMIGYCEPVSLATSAGDLFGMVSSRNPNSKVKWPPTIGNKKVTLNPLECENHVSNFFSQKMFGFLFFSRKTRKSLRFWEVASPGNIPTSPRIGRFFFRWFWLQLPIRIPYGLVGLLEGIDRAMKKGSFLVV